ncbi:MAG: SDR family NAD(P)-dependent oxidoreductase [Gemmataceae bacterium]|nr:SDR family NAD(P)-dependent oxidoreductase [Gemmataceae bacterium]
MSDFAGKTALITGAGSGIGRHLARLLLAAGARVAGVDLDGDSLRSLEAEHPGRPIATAAGDVTDLPALRAAVAGLEERLGPADLLIACAGIGRATPADEWDAEAVNAVLSVNLAGVVNSIGAVLPGMRARRSGHLVVLSSLASYRGMPLMAAYSASKAGCNALCDSLRVELRSEGIRVTTVCPGWIKTPMTEKLGLPDAMLYPLEKAAPRILDAIRRRKAFIAFPWGLAWRVWLLRVLPRPLGDWLAGRLLKQFRERKA